MILKITKDAATLHSTATPAILAVLPRIEGRRQWVDRGTKLRVEVTPWNISILGSIPGVVIEEEPRVKISTRIKRDTYQFKTQPFDHQTKALEKFDECPHFGLFMEQGTGKTKVCIDRGGELFCNKEITGMFILSKKGVHRQWIESEFAAHCGVPYYGEYWSNKTKPDFTKNMHPNKDTLKVFSMNYDALRTKKGMDAAVAFCKEHDQQLLIVCDESQEIKNSRAQRHKAACNLRPFSTHRIIATGTPIAKDLTDEWAQLKWLNESIIGIRYVTAFRNEYCIMGGFENRQVVGHRNVERFKELTAPFIFRVTKDDIGILPKLFNTWGYDLDRTQVDTIRQIKRELEAELACGEIVSIANAVAGLNKIQQVSSGFILDSEGKAHDLFPHYDKNPKLNAMLDWYYGREGKAIIWLRFKHEAKMVCDVLERNNIPYVQYTGSDHQRADAVKSFLTEEIGAEVFVANPQSAGTGLNLQGLCSRALYYSNSFNAIDRYQSEDRIHRIGTTKVCTYTDMVGAGTLDRYILNNLRKKKGISDLVLDDIKDLLGSL